MARRRIIRSLSVPITLASITVPLSIALLVGWTLLVVQKAALPENAWMLVLGALAFVLIVTVLVMFAVFLVREVLEVRRQDTFIDSVTHELKSPLASLKLCLETLGREGLHDERREELRQMMLEDVDRLSAFIDDVLQASRLAHDRVRFDVSEVDMRELVERCADGVAARAKVPRDALTVDIEPGTTFYSDRAALEIVLKNLLDNAVKYSSETVDVRVTARVDDGVAAIEVRDRGIGIPRKLRKRVFQRFFRVQSEQVRAERGTGLGLFVVSALVRNLGGRIQLSSGDDGVGTAVRLKLPGAPPGSSAEEPEASTDGERAAPEPS